VSFIKVEDQDNSIIFDKVPRFFEACNKVSGANDTVAAGMPNAAIQNVHPCRTSVLKIHLK
jgi:hypothetical protein